MNTMRRIVLLLLIPILGACNLVDRGGDSDPSVRSRILVANGGNFGDQDGFITRYDPESGTTSETLSLNGFLQGITADGDRIYALLNTFSEGRIAILDQETLDQVGQFSSLPAPRAMAVLDGVAYVSNLLFGMNGTLVPIDLSSGSVGTAIEVGMVPEGVAVLGSNIYVANNGNLGDGNTLSVVRPGATIASVLAVGCDGPRDIFADVDRELIVVCSGKTVYNADFSEILSSTNGAILFIEGTSGTETARIDLSVQPGATNGTASSSFSPERSELYLTSGSSNQVFRIDTESHTIDSVTDLSSDVTYIGVSGVAYDASSDLVYIGRFPKAAGGPFPDFSAAGIVLALDRDGNEAFRFDAGTAPSQILILKE